MIDVGIVGLPNVGKSTLFNALTAAGAPSENYPFCTVDPNVGIVEVPDLRLEKIHELAGSATTVPTAIRFVDIAGLVEGASEGEGLGNKFLANIREVNAIVHVLRCFDDPDVAHVSGSVDPLRDRDIIHTELALADLDLVERRLERVSKKAKSGEKEAIREKAALERALVPLTQGIPLRNSDLSDEDRHVLRQYQFLTDKPMLYVTNVGEGDLPEGRNAYTEALRADVVEEVGHQEILPISSQMEAELAELDEAEAMEFLEAVGLHERGLDRLIHAAYHLLGLITFFTTGEKETRAWTVKRGATAPEAAGEIHTDFQRGFIRAETIGFEEFVEVGSMKVARDRGLIRSEGKEYVVQDGDIILFRFNV